MQQSDTPSSYYQYYQSHLQNPNPNLIDPSLASAPPVSSTYSPSDYSPYSNPSTYPPYPQYTDHAPNYPPNPNPQPYDFPHLNPQTTPYYPHDQNQAAVNYDQPALNYDQPAPSYDYTNASYNDSNQNSSFSSNLFSSVPDYGNLYGSSSNFGYGDEGKQRAEIGSGYDYGMDGVYAYKGGKVAPYGAGGSGSGSGPGLNSSGVIFDDYGRPIGLANGKEKNGSGISGKVEKAIPKSVAQEDVYSGVQKFRVKLLSEGVGQSDVDVLCQIGLDGIRILDLATSRTLRIYPLETVIRCEVLDSYIFAFWAKTSIDVEPRRIRLKSNSYTANNILDTVTAATFQIKEMGGRNKPSDISKVSEQPSEKKKGFVDWVNLMKPSTEEKDHWIPDEAVAKCKSCGTDFGAFVRRHHCRNCGGIFCDKCTQGRIALTADEAATVRVCDQCMAEVTQRLTNAKETAGKVAAFQSHEDLAKTLKEEMEKNRKTSTGLTFNGSGTRMKEVACPTCTVHLQVQVPASGSETIDCSVCQHPFLVNAH
ncbi:protein FREE1-like isoform X2 [Rhododendron vialii]|uniref:protein FREE1-like isoform X2 n=1 Tax=Rhododendron vialii TaxID=182163 RepID=UPI00265F091D|nr:protein FREE1-like isoform X2 [Rhododendron vialii]